MLKPANKRRALPVTAMVITSFGLLLGSGGNTFAQQSQRVLAAPAAQPADAGLRVLESAFWVCDYVATTRGNSDISTCTAVYEALKERKFAGDFDALVSWWQQNKVAQHRNVAVADSQGE
ncbi:MAG: hypothetical protein H7X75_08460 [Burkholderiaceae bacterium]|nr:hypothetical protein [Burkholderiaceae bacterium]